MSFVTLEVEIDHGRVIARGREPLPDKAAGLLTLLPESAASIGRRESVGEFVRKWAGAFTVPVDAPGDDPRMAYLLGKHVKSP